MTQAIIKTPTPAGPYVAIALVACAILLFEVLVTRILSVTLSYHFAFLTISLAMVGLAAPGVWFSVAPPKPWALIASLYAAAVALPASVLAIVHVGARSPGDVFWIAVIVIPMLALGAAVCLLLLHARGEAVTRMYAADLTGAAIGALAAVPLLRGLPTPSVVAALGLLPLLAAVLVGSRRHLLNIGYALVLLASAVWTEPYTLRYTRFYVEDQEPLYEKWSATARVTVFDGVNPQFIGWGMGTRYRGATIGNHLWLDQDGSAGTPILKYKPGEPFPEQLAYDVVSAGYQVASPRRACIVGGGGGRDVLKALQGGATEVEAVELNPYIVDAVSRAFRDHSGDPYHLPGVRAIVGEGRNHFSRSTTPCDIVEISQIDTFAASAAGAYALTENSLYTVEAIRMFWSRLSDDGVLSISRWVSGPAWPESVRLVVLEIEALRREGITEPQRHMIVLAAGDTANVLVFRQPVSTERLARANAVAAERGYGLLWPAPLTGADVPEITRAIANGPDSMIRRGYDVSPPTDDRPFFFQTLNILSAMPADGGPGSHREQSVTVLRRLLVILLTLTLVLMVLPVIARGALPRGPRVVRHTLFFSCLGFGFMFVEIPLLQRLALYLGHPSYATTVVLGSLLVGAGVGASLAGRIPTNKRRVVAFLVPAVLATFVSVLLWLAVRTIAQPFAVRATISIVLLTGAGAVMGMLLPLAMSLFDDRERSWYWAINGATSVLGSVMALVIALVAGFTVVVTCAVALYVLAALMVPTRRAVDRSRSC